MSVFTPVGAAELDAWLRDYDVGTATELTPIAAGIENTNYFVNTDRGRYVLTLFERVSAVELPYYLDLMSHLARQGIPCPAPVQRRDGARFASLMDRPTALLTRLPGASVERPTEAQCAAVGAMLAQLHQAGLSFPAHPPNPRGARWRRDTGQVLLPLLGPDDAALLKEELHFQSLFNFPDLPHGVVHGDLFRDNVLFAPPDGARIGGVIDFYFAGEDAWLFDLGSLRQRLVRRHRRRTRPGANPRAAPRLPRAAPPHRDRARRLAGAAARRGAALLAVAARRPPAPRRRPPGPRQGSGPLA